jgi:DNA-binding LacI/PurR family transcriptional regulator
MLAPQEPLERYAIEQRILGLHDAGYAVSAIPTGAAACLTLYPMLSTLDGARQVAAELARTPDRPSAVYGYNDERTSMLLRALHEQGLRVPQEIALVGTDALSFGELVIPSLTTVQFDLIGLAQRCIQALQHQIRGEALPPGLLDEMHPRLIIRESCA